MGAPRTEPVELHTHAMENLRYIRRTLERAGAFTAVPGIGGMLMGSTALAAAYRAATAAEAGPHAAIAAAVARAVPAAVHTVAAMAGNEPADSIC